jgi:hypothetical protein
VCDGSEWRCVRLSDDMKVGWDRVYLVSVRHPDLVISVEKNVVHKNVVTHLKAPIESLE